MANERPTANLNELLEKKQLEQKRAENWLPLKVAAGAWLGASTGAFLGVTSFGFKVLRSMRDSLISQGIPVEDVVANGKVEKHFEQAMEQEFKNVSTLKILTQKTPRLAAIGAAIGAGGVALAHSFSAKQKQADIEKITTSEGWQHYLENQQASTDANRGRV